MLYGSSEQLEAWEASAYDDSAVVPTGYKAFDKYLKRGGLRKRQLAGLLGRSAVGKTALAINIISNAIRGGYHVAFASTEMDCAEVVNRLIAVHYGLPVQSLEDKARDGLLHQEYYSRYEVDFRRLLIEDDTSMSVERLSDFVRIYRSEMGASPDLLVQDYMNILEVPGYGNIVTKTQEVARALKALARVHGIAVLTLVQTGRAKEGDSTSRNHGHIPLTMEDAMYGGEQSFDVLLAMYRPELDPDADNPNLQFGSRAEQERYERARLKRAQYKNKAVLQVVKNRFGQTNLAGEEVDINWATMRIVQSDEDAKARDTGV